MGPQAATTARGGRRARESDRSASMDIPTPPLCKGSLHFLRASRPLICRLQHVASNPYTRYRPFPAPAQFAASPDLVRRMTTFLRRELRVWPNLDVEVSFLPALRFVHASCGSFMSIIRQFLTTYTISLMKSIDIRSESAVKLLSEFLDLDTPYTAGARHVNAEHFAHGRCGLCRFSAALTIL
jgi:hypothetical protein